MMRTLSGDSRPGAPPHRRGHGQPFATIRQVPAPRTDLGRPVPKICSRSEPPGARWSYSRRENQPDLRRGAIIVQRIRSMARTALLGISVTLLGTFSVAGSASASVTTPAAVTSTPANLDSVLGYCSKFGQNVSVHGVGVYNGTFCMDAVTSGGKLTQLQYGWGVVIGSECLWWVDFDVYGPPGKGLIYHNQGTYNPRCNSSGHGTRTGGGVPVPLPIAAPVGGQACSTFWREGPAGPVRVAEACQAITAKTSQLS
jgi:hypothetical protein